jgi:hypothetical protein
MTSALEQLQQVAIDQISTDAMFDGSQSVNGAVIPIITEMKGDIQTEIAIQLGKIGLCVIVLTPVFELHDPMIPSLNGYAHMSIVVRENVVLNQTGIRSIQAAQNILGLLHFFPLPASIVADINENRLGSDRKQSAIQLTNAGQPLEYLVPFMAHLQITRPA